MPRDDRFYAFMIAHTSRSRSRIQRIRVDKKALRIFSVVAVVLAVGLAYGLYGLTQQAAHLQTEFENQRLHAENERQQQELNRLNNRIAAVEDTSRRLAEKSGVVHEESSMPGTGGPALPLDANGMATLQAKMNRLERDMRAYEAVLRERGYTPSIWPVDGKLESGFGGRRNPFGGSGYEFHSGQDIEAPWGGYGQLVVIDHGGGLTTRYGHLSHIDVTLDEAVSRGQFIARVGSTGRSTGPHLHYEVRINDEAVNPLQYLLTSPKQ
jgi:murein DD-endopeptidase MepM/ murein hydrolase activator NlpD